MLLFWTLIIAAVVVVVRGLSGGRARTALDILGERYARGEIDKGEFERKRHDLAAS